MEQQYHEYDDLICKSFTWLLSRFNSNAQSQGLGFMQHACIEILFNYGLPLEYTTNVDIAFA